MAKRPSDQISVYTGWLKIKCPAGQNAISRQLKENFWPKYEDLTLLPAKVFATFAGKHISSSRAYSDKILKATPMFSGSTFLVVVLPVLRDIDVCSKSKMAAN